MLARNVRPSSPRQDDPAGTTVFSMLFGATPFSIPEASSAV
jgi:hypothetical protein